MSNTRLIFLIGNGANRKKVWELPAKRWIVCVSYIVGIKICANFLFFLFIIKISGLKGFISQNTVLNSVLNIKVMKLYF